MLNRLHVNLHNQTLIYLPGAGIPYERICASSRGCWTIFAGVVLERHSEKRFKAQAMPRKEVFGG